MNHRVNEETLYTPTKAAPLLYNIKTKKSGISEQRVRQLCAAGHFGRKVGAGWIITAMEIETFNQSNRPAGRPSKDKRR